MQKIIEQVARRLGGEKLFEAYGHHLPRMGRVLIVGGIGFIIQSIIFELLGIRFALVAPSTAALIGAEVAVLSNFTLNNRFNFREATEQHPLMWRLVRFHLVGVGSLASQWTCIFVTEHFTTDHLILRAAFVLGVGIGFIFNYTGYYFFVWRR